MKGMRRVKIEQVADVERQAANLKAIKYSDDLRNVIFAPVLPLARTSKVDLETFRVPGT
jgi:hypothetical protein